MTQRTASRGRESSHRIPRRDEQVVGGGRKPNPGCGARGGAASQAPPRHRQVSGASGVGGELGSGALRNSNGKLSSGWLLRRGPTCHGRFKLGPNCIGL